MVNIAILLMDRPELSVQAAGQPVGTREGRRNGERRGLAAARVLGVGYGWVGLSSCRVCSRSCRSLSFVSAALAT